MAAHFHHVPGRLRVHVPRIKGSVADARALESSLSAIKGVSGVESRELTGSVIIHYDPKALNPQTLISAIGVTPFPLTAAASPVPPLVGSVPKRIAGKLVNVVAWQLLELAAERAVPLLVAAIL